jgi:uncharacterized membrane protein YhiD involved in acid resistance
MIGPAIRIPVGPGSRALAGTDIPTIALVLLGTLALGVIIATVYRVTHRGLSYSQAFQFSLVLLSLLAATIMMVASTGIIPAVGIIGGFSLIRFRTPVKDPKDMAYILFSLAVGLAMGIRLYPLAAMATGLICAVIIVLTRLNFGLTSEHESIIRLTCTARAGEPVQTEPFEATLARTAQSHHLLSAVGQDTRMELTYGVRPRRGSTSLTVLEALRAEPTVEHAELFDAKHQVEF